MPPNEARKRIARILSISTIVFWDHCKNELAKDDLNSIDAINVLRVGRITEQAEQQGGLSRWRYRVHTDSTCVVVQFEGEDCTPCA